jgi:hypothetical protein
MPRPALLFAFLQVVWSWATSGGLTLGPYSRKDLVIPGPLSPNAAVTATLRAKFDGETEETVLEVALTPKFSPIKANLRGPSGDVRADREFILNATSSVDPDDPTNTRRPFVVDWECIRDDFPNPCFPGKAFGNQRGLVWTIPAGLLEPGRVHSFKAIVSKSDNRTSGMAGVAITPKADIPTGRLVRVCGAVCPEKHSADMPLALSMVLDASSAGAAVAWTSDQVTSINSNDGEPAQISKHSSASCTCCLTSTCTELQGVTHKL